jgi:hypothetical protein
MEDDELLFEIKEHEKKSRNTFESAINKKCLNDQEMDAVFNDFN